MLRNCDKIKSNSSFVVKENSHSKLPNVGGEEIQVTVPVIMSNGDLYVRKVAAEKHETTNNVSID